MFSHHNFNMISIHIFNDVPITICLFNFEFVLSNEIKNIFFDDI